MLASPSRVSRGTMRDAAGQVFEACPGLMASDSYAIAVQRPKN